MNSCHFLRLHLSNLQMLKVNRVPPESPFTKYPLSTKLWLVCVGKKTEPGVKPQYGKGMVILISSSMCMWTFLLDFIWGPPVPQKRSNINYESLTLT